MSEGLKTFDPSATASYTAVEITPDGVIVRGEIGSAPRRAPVVHIAETHQGAAFTAFQSWIPAGRIDRFIWSWVEHGRELQHLVGRRKILHGRAPLHSSQTAGPHADQSDLSSDRGRPASRRAGTQLGIAAGTTCQVPEPEFAIDVPSWWEPVTLPIWRPDLDDTVPLRDAIAGHISVQNDAPGQEPFSRNALVYFADWRSERPLDALSCRAEPGAEQSALMVIVVLPAGAFDSSRREIREQAPIQPRARRRADAVHRR